MGPIIRYHILLWELTPEPLGSGHSRLEATHGFLEIGLRWSVPEHCPPTWQHFQAGAPRVPLVGEDSGNGGSQTQV